MIQTPALTSPKTQAQPQYEITEKDKKRAKSIAFAWKAYEGELDPPLEKMPGHPDDNVLSNRMQPVVDRGVEFLFGKELEISVGQDAPEAQELLNTAWGRKEKRVTLLQKLAMNGAIAGSAFLRIVPEPNGSFRLVLVDPAIVYVQTAPQDCDTVTLYCLQYRVQEQSDGVRPNEVYYREEIARIDADQDGDDGDPFADTDAQWRIQHWSRKEDQETWTASGDPIIWPYPFPPLFSCQNLLKPNDFWGYPDITPDLIGVNNSLNLVQSDINRTLKLYGNPMLYSVGIGEQIIDVKPGKITQLPTPESKIEAVNIVSDVANGLTFAANLRSDIDEQSGVPAVATGRIADLPRGNMSGIAIELLFMPILKKTDKKRCLYGELIIDVSQALLVLSGMNGDSTINLPWQSPLPSGDLQSVQAAQLKKQIGISNQTLQRELGYDPVEEAEFNQQEDAQQLIAYSRGQGLPPMPPQQQMQPGEPSQGGGQ